MGDDGKPEGAKPDVAADAEPDVAADAEPDVAADAKPAVTGPAQDTKSAPAPHTPTDPSQPTVIAPEPDTGYTADGVPTLEGVREKIESRYGTALGATELAEETREGRSAAERYDTVHKAAAEKLDEIRASMHEKDQPGGR